jgi:glycolate oxidase iron-sulfur subunit
MKQAIEGERPSRLTQVHLDRCLTCRACETTCPSGVQYHRLYDVAKKAVDAAAPRPFTERLARFAIRKVFVEPRRLAVLLALARPFRAVLPAALRGKIMPRVAPGASPSGVHERRMTLLRGCVQAATAPQINAANRRVFDAVGVGLSETPGVGCCGALSFHNGAADEGRALARRNIDAWTAELDSGAEAVVINASGCAAFVRDYPDILADDPVYAPRARRVVERLRDPVEILEASALVAARAPREPRIAVHPPCTLRNGPRLADAPARLLARLGYQPQPIRDAHLCCGSAGAYSLLQPEMAKKLRAAKIAALTAGAPRTIYTANIGCWMHLRETSPVAVRHWIEAVDDVLGGAPGE